MLIRPKKGDKIRKDNPYTRSSIFTDEKNRLSNYQVVSCRAEIGQTRVCLKRTQVASNSFECINMIIALK